MKTYHVVFEIESERPAPEVASNIRSAMQRHGLEASGIDVYRDTDPRSPLNQLRQAKKAEYVLVKK